MVLPLPFPGLDEVNAYLKEITCAPVSAKDFRTLHASALAAEELVRIEPGPSEQARQRQVAQVMKRVASFLQNTPAIARQSYVVPCLISLFERGRLVAAWTAAGEGPVASGLRKREMCLAAVIAGQAA